MESKCHEVFEKVAKVHDNGHVLAKVWDGLTAERRSESITRLFGMVDDLNDEKIIRPQDYKETFNFLNTLDQYNRGIGTIHNLVEQIDNVTSELAINAIADCKCVVGPNAPPSDRVSQFKEEFKKASHGAYKG